MSDQAEKLRLLVRSLREQVRQPATPPRGRCRVVTVTSGKGGVGKTSLALALSLALAGQGHRVLLLDGDMGLANVDVLLGLVPRHNLYHVIRGEKGIREIIQEGPLSLKIIPGASGLEDLANLDAGGMARFLEEFASLEHSFDYLIIDTGAGISSQVMAFILAAEEILLVTTPDPTALTDAYGLIKVFKGHQGKGRLRLVVNMVKSEEEGREVACRLERVVSRFLHSHLEVAGYIPLDQAVVEAVRRNQSFITAFPGAPASRHVRQLAAALSGLVPEEPLNRGQGGFMKKCLYFLLGR